MQWGPKKAEVLWKFDDSEVPKSVLALRQVCSDKTASSLSFDALFVCLVPVLWLSLNAKERQYSADHGDRLLGFLPVESGEVEIVGGDAGLDMDVSKYGSRSPEVVPLHIAVSHTTASSSRKMRVSVISQAKLSFCEPLRKYTNTELGVTLEGKIWRCCSRVVSYCCEICGTRDMSSIRHGAGKSHPCVRCMTSFGNMVHGKLRPSRRLAATAEKQRQVKSLEKIAETVSERA